MDGPAIFLTAAVIIFMAALVAYRLRTPRSERLRQEIREEFSDADSRLASILNNHAQRITETEA
jgi:sensor domain CHASE-containing protein